MRILIGYDGSECADAALDDLQLAGLPPDAEAQILSVAEVWLPPPPASGSEAGKGSTASAANQVVSKQTLAVQEALVMAERAAARVKTNFPNWNVLADASGGSPAWELVFRADQWKPDLVVVGSHGRTALGRFVLGSVSQRVLTEARCSVRIARGRVEEANTPARIVVGVDGSPGSEAAVRQVASRKWPVGTEVRLMVIDDPLVPQIMSSLMSTFTEGVSDSNEADHGWVGNILAAAAALLQPADVKVTTLRSVGDPKRELPRAAEEWDADCVFVGSTGFSNRFERFVLGSVSAAVAARAHCSVEVVRS